MTKWEALTVIGCVWALAFAMVGGIYVQRTTPALTMEYCLNLLDGLEEGTAP